MRTACKIQSTESTPKLTLLASNQSNSATKRHKYKEVADEQVIALCQKGDNEAFCELIRRHERFVYGLLYQLAPDWRNDTADFAQEVFIRVWRSIHSLRNPLSFRAWLSHIATNLFYDELRKRPKVSPISIDQCYVGDDGSETGSLDIPDCSELPDEVRQRHELTECIGDAMAKLPEHFRTAIILRELQGLSYEQIAQITKSEIGTVKSRIARARLKIQDMISPMLEISA
jgi:RNA polymerase sigma-70 factor (ECF subfamily)